MADVNLAQLARRKLTDVNFLLTAQLRTPVASPHPVDFLLQRPPDNLSNGCVFPFRQFTSFGDHFGWDADPSGRLSFAHSGVLRQIANLWQQKLPSFQTCGANLLPIKHAFWCFFVHLRGWKRKSDEKPEDLLFMRF